MLVSFGAPERRQDVMPFLERVTAGRGISQSRIAAGGRALLRRRRRQSAQRPVPGVDGSVAYRVGGPRPALYWGNRNWHPLLDDTMAKMRDDHIERALAFVTSAYGGYSSCRQYLDDIEQPGDGWVMVRPRWTSCASITTTRGGYSRGRRSFADPRATWAPRRRRCGRSDLHRSQRAGAAWLRPALTWNT